MQLRVQPICRVCGETRPRFLTPQFQTELRKILLSLIEVAQKLLALSPGAVELFTKANGRSKPGVRRDPACRPCIGPTPSTAAALKLDNSGLLCTWVPVNCLCCRSCS